MPRLLLVEDNPHIMRISHEQFSREGFETIVAPDGETGVTLAQTQSPDVIILDIMLPKLSGFDVLKLLRDNPQTASIPVYIHSNRGWPDDMQRALALGARKFFSKGSAAVQDIVREIRGACGFKQVILLTKTPTGAAPIKEALQHPRLLCSVVMALAGVGTAAERSTPEAIILDARAPGNNAPVQIQQLKSRPATANIPTIAVVADPQSTLPGVECIPATSPTELREVVLRLTGLEDHTAPVLAGVA